MVMMREGGESRRARSRSPPTISLLALKNPGGHEAEVRELLSPRGQLLAGDRDPGRRPE
jgi:hypothetical protein